MCADKTFTAVRLRGAPRRATPVTRGLSLVELMVGIVIALLVSLTATGGAMLFTATQRQGIGTGGSMISSGTALAALRDDVAAAGLGFFGDSQFLCRRLNLSVDTSVLVNGADFTPVAIAAEAAGDRIDVLYATDVASGANVLLNNAATADTAQLRSLLPVAAGQAVLLAPATPGDPCVVRTVTANTAATIDTPQTIEFDNVATARFNRAAFTTNPTYPDRGRVTLLGDLRWSRYRRVGNDLVLQRPLGGGDVVLARNVMAFRAEYGLAAAGTTSLASWQPASGGFATLTPANLPRVRALRIGLVTRSPQREKPDAAGNCQASAAKPTDPFDASVDVEPDVTDWQCYRYRTATLVVPLRNLVIGMVP
ncbi:MAG: PilW family protein [Rubrivivax sp.]|nr:PilW family protein [Rubrivivax sp.]